MLRGGVIPPPIISCEGATSQVVLADFNDFMRGDLVGGELYSIVFNINNQAETLNPCDDISYQLNDLFEGGIIASYDGFDLTIQSISDTPLRVKVSRDISNIVQCPV